MKAFLVRSPSKQRIRSWVPRWRASSGSIGGRKQKAEVPAALAAQVSAELVVDAMSSEMADAVHAAAQAAADNASDMGMTDAQCVKFYNAAVGAASQSLDPAGQSAGGQSAGGGASLAQPAARVEAILVRAIRKSAVRVVDLFQVSEGVRE